MHNSSTSLLDARPRSPLMAVQRSAQSSTSPNFQIRHAWIERLPTSSHARIELCLPHVAQLINRTSECGGSRGQAGKRRCGWREEEERGKRKERKGKQSGVPRDTEPDAAVREARRVAAADGGTHVVRVVVPRAAAKHAEFTRHWAKRIRLRGA